MTVITVVLEDAVGFLETLRSVHDQAYQAQHVVIDGGSRSPEMRSALKQAVELGAHVTSEPDAGAYDAMNKGLEIASNDAVSFLNAGDSFKNSDSLSQLATLVKNATCGYGAVQLESAQGARTYRFRPFRRALLKFGIRWVPHPSSVVRREALLRAGGFGRDYGHAADQAVFLRLSLETMPSITSQVITRFPLGGKSTQGSRETDEQFHKIRVDLGEPLFHSARFDASLAKGLATGRRAVRHLRHRSN